MAASTSSRAGPSRCGCGGRCGSSAGEAGRSSPRAWRRPSWGATGSSAWSRTSSTPPPRSGGRIWSRWPGSPASASRGSPGSSSSTSTGWLSTSLAPGPLPRLRRGRHLLGAGRDGADARRDRRGRGAGGGPGQAAGLPRRAHPRPRGAALGGAAAGPSARPRGASRQRARGALRAWRLFFERLAEVTRRCWSSRTCSGRTPRCSTSSSTCSTGRATTPSIVLTLCRPELHRAPAQLGRRPAQLHASLPRAALAGGDGGAARRARARAARRASRADPRAAPRECPSTRSRRCGCCSTGACSSAEGACYRLAGPIGDAGGPGDACTR